MNAGTNEETESDTDVVLLTNDTDKDRQLKVLEHIMRKKGMKNLNIINGIIKVRRNKE